MRKMIEKGYPTEEILFLAAGYSRDDIEELRKESVGIVEQPV